MASRARAVTWLGSPQWLAAHIGPTGSPCDSGSSGKTPGSESSSSAAGGCGVVQRGDSWCRPSLAWVGGPGPRGPRGWCTRQQLGAHCPLPPQAGAALLQRECPVLPGAQPVLRAAAPVPGVPQWHTPARGRAGLHGPLPACRRVPHVHRGVPGHLQEPAAVPAPEVSV